MSSNNAKKCVLTLCLHILNAYVFDPGSPKYRDVHAGKFRKPMSYNSPWFNAVIKSYLEKNAKTEFVYSFSIDNRPYTIVVVGCVPKSSVEQNSSVERDQLLRRIKTWLRVLHTVKEPFVQPLVVYIFQSKLKKTLPRRGVTIGVEHVNSAFTAYCEHNHEYDPDSVPTEIVIYREQEQFKVFIHETFHNFHVDFCSKPDDAAYARIRKLFGVRSKVLIHEAYTETWATIVNICFRCVEGEMTRVALIKPKNSNTKLFVQQLLVRFLQHIDDERQFSICQMKKVLAHNGLTYADFVSNPVAAYEYTEASNVLAYYVIKCILLFHYEEFINWCNKHNSNWFCFDQSDTSSTSQHSFCDLIESLYRRRLFLKAVFEAQEPEDKTSLRMTLFGL